ncbi:MAG: hypothetical protein AB8H80_06090 [Planctomycetota bacterium]
MMSLRDLDQALVANAANRRRKVRLERGERDALSELAVARGDLRRFDKNVRAASAKVKDLEGWSLGLLFGTMFGSRQDRIADEKEQLVKEQLRRDGARQAVPALEEQLEGVRAELAHLADVDQEFTELVVSKAELLHERGDDGARKIVESSQRLGELEDHVRELNEALAVAEALRGHLKRAVVDLEGARSWGRVDMLGGGVFVDYGKHSNLDRAKERIHAAQRLMRRLRKELDDVHVAMPTSDLGISGFAVFADWFFDGLIADWFMQSRIVNALTRVQRGHRIVARLVRDLRARVRDAEGERAALEAERREWVDQTL